MTWISPNIDGFTIIVCVDQHLEDRKPATGEVEENISDAPSTGALSAEIHECLWHVLDQRDAQFYVATRVEKIEPVYDIAEGQYDQCGHTKEENG